MRLVFVLADESRLTQAIDLPKATLGLAFTLSTR